MSSVGTVPNAPLPRWESTLCIGTWMTLVLLMLVSLFEASRDYADHRDVIYKLDDGWEFLGRLKDDEDSEWVFWRSSVLGVLGKGLAIHVILSQILRHRLLFAKRKYFFLVYSLLFYIHVVGFGPLILIIMETLVLFLIVWFTTSHALVWTVMLSFLLTLNIETLRQPLMAVGLLKRGSFLAYYFQEYTLFVVILRLTSFGLFRCDFKKRMRTAAKPLSDSCLTENQQNISEAGTERSPTNSDAKSSISLDGRDFLKTEFNDKEKDMNWATSAFSGSPVAQLIDLFFYALYLPLLVAGPMMNFDVFYTQFYGPLKPWTFRSLKPVAVGLCRVVVWGFLYEFLLHYFYGGILLNNPHLLSVLPLWAIAGTSYVCGMFFVVKYMVIWAFYASIARLDQLEPPDIPSCGSHIYLYSNMWKSFDRGLYAFLKQHIYILLGGSRHGLLRQLIALLACFGFIAAWHGLHNHILLWCLFNFFTIVLEAVARSVTALTAVKEFEAKHFSPAMVRRLHSLAIIPVFMVSSFSLVAFFAGLRSSKVLVYRLFIEGFPISTLLIVVSMYCVIQTGKEVENYRAKTNHLKTD